MVAATLSINYPFGSGFVIPGTGVLLNNEMDDFSSKAGTPNAFGLVHASANAIGPRKRPTF
jgi:gamma-glutamyltranspeptidase/glutathione hydrolase